MSGDPPLLLCPPENNKGRKDASNRLKRVIASHFIIPPESCQEFENLPKFDSGTIVFDCDVSLRPVLVLDGAYEITGTISYLKIQWVWRNDSTASVEGGEDGFTATKVDLGVCRLSLTKKPGCSGNDIKRKIENATVDWQNEEVGGINQAEPPTMRGLVEIDDEFFVTAVWDNDEDAGGMGTFKQNCTSKFLGEGEDDYDMIGTNREEKQQSLDNEVQHSGDGDNDNDPKQTERDMDWFLMQMLPTLQVSVGEIDCTVAEHVPPRDLFRIASSLLRMALLMGDSNWLCPSVASTGSSRHAGSSTTTQTRYVVWPSLSVTSFRVEILHSVEERLSVQMDNVLWRESQWRCEALNAAGTVCDHLFFSKSVGVEAMFIEDAFNVHMEELSTFQLQGFGYTKSPTKNVHIYFNEQEIHVACTEVEIGIFSSSFVNLSGRMTDTRQSSPLEGGSGDCGLDETQSGRKGELDAIDMTDAISKTGVRFFVQLSAQKVRVKHDDSQYVTEMYSVEIDLELLGGSAFAKETFEGGFSVLCRIGYSNFNWWLHVRNFSITGILNEACSSLYGLTVTVGEGQLHANRLSKKWITLLLQAGSDRDSMGSLRAEFASVSPMKFAVWIENDAILGGKRSLDVADFIGDCDTTLGRVISHYCLYFLNEIRALEKKVSNVKTNVSDSVAASVGRVALGVGMASPVGLATSVAAIGIKDGVAKAASVGKISRGGTEDGCYQFGDVTRGIIARMRQSASADTRMQDRSVGPIGDASAVSTSERKGYISENKARLSMVGGSSVGAAVGLGLIGGPVGLLAGSYLGGRAAVQMVQRNDNSANEDTEDSASENDSAPFLPSSTIVNGPPEAAVDDSSQQRNRYRSSVPPASVSVNNTDVATPHGPSSRQRVQTDDTRGYRFGDITRGIIARGKRADNRDENSSYKFGDFTRGLFRG